MTDKNILQRYEERRKRIAEERMLEEEAAKKRAYAAARQIVRKKAEEKAGADYEQLGPTQRETVDRAVADKELVKKVALRLLPKFKTGNRDSSFTHGTKLDNHGSDERQHPGVETFGAAVKESLLDVHLTNINDKFSKNFRKGEESANTKGGKKEKGSPVVQYSKFGEQVYGALERKSEKTGIDISILGEVFVRGLDAHVNANTRLTREQYAFARVNSFISKGKTYYTEDRDLAEDLEQLQELGGDQHYGDTKGAFSKGAKGTPITRNKMAGYALDSLETELKSQRQTKKSVNDAKKRYGIKEEEDLKPVSSIEKVAKKHGISVDEMKARLKEGIKVEKEHTKETSVAATIALKHLSEKPDYYAKLKKYVEEVDLDEGRAPGTPSIKRYTRNDGTTALKSLNKWGKRKDWRDSEGGLAKAKAHAGVDTVTEEVQQTNENFIDGKGPGKPGDSARHGLKGKSASELRKIRSSETASPRTKQLAHWMLNMHHNEETELDEKRGLWDNIHAKRKRIKAGSGERMRTPGAKGAPTAQDFKDASESYVNEEEERIDAKTKVEGTNCRNCVYWRRDLEKPVTKEELNPNGGLKAPNKEYIAMSKRFDLGTLPGKDSSVKIKGFCDHDGIKDWVTERMCCSQWDSDGMIRDYKGTSPVMDEETNSEKRMKVTAVARPGEEKMRKHVSRLGDPKATEDGQKLTRNAEIKHKIIDEDHPNCGTPECCGQCNIGEEGNSQPDPSKRLIGTDSLVKAYKTDTPGETPAKPKKAINESLNESFNIAYAAGIGQTFTAADLGMRMQGAFAHHPDTIRDMEELEAMKEDATTKTKSPVVIPPIRKPDGTYIPARTVMRTTNKKIIKGDPNVHDGQ